ncbi:MAG: hypothetical protein KTR28_04765 [Micavibrio sp.]|nr:hypothetical protein [Micavibrio sp.]
MNILQAQDAHFKLSDDGGVFYQKLPNNPLPGEQVGTLHKGESVLKPKISLVKSTETEGLDDAEVQARLEQWLEAHTKSTLELLIALDTQDEVSAPVKAILEQVYNSMGIIPREQLEGLIGQLDADMRKELRNYRVRLGPILVFIPALNKPAAVRLRALLFGIYNDKDLPMPLPKDGIVSYEIDPAEADKAYQQAIGYPVFGNRAIRIDMLDRVISAIYDSADKGQFKAQHKMAEWLGSSIEGLYDVLTAMGHTKVSEPAAPAESTAKAEEKSVEEAISSDAPIAVEPKESAVSLDDLKAAEGAESAPKEKVEEKAADKSEEKPAEKKVEVKPELVTFRLKKGKAFEKSAGGGKRPFNKDKKPYNKDKKEPSKKSHGDKKGGKKGGKPQDRGPRVIKAEVEKKLEDSPFAILQQLKK